MGGQTTIENRLGVVVRSDEILEMRNKMREREKRKKKGIKWMDVEIKGPTMVNVRLRDRGGGGFIRDGG